MFAIAKFSPEISSLRQNVTFFQENSNKGASGRYNSKLNMVLYFRDAVYADYLDY